MFLQVIETAAPGFGAALFISGFKDNLAITGIPIGCYTCMSTYKAVIINIGKLYLYTAVLVVLGILYICVMSARFLKGAYMETFSETPM